MPAIHGSASPTPTPPHYSGYPEALDYPNTLVLMTVYRCQGGRPITNIASQRALALASVLGVGHLEGSWALRKTGGRTEIPEISNLRRYKLYYLALYSISRSDVSRDR
jgi:hypothetical protein